MGSRIIGIDLGTTHSCVAIYDNVNVEILSNKLGSRTTPSWVAYNSEGLIVGDIAKDQAVFDPENTIYDMKRLIGNRYNDDAVQHDIKHWFFDVICEDEFCKVKVTWDDEVKEFKPEEISAIILSEMKEIAESYFEEEIRRAVITVPAYFSDQQRLATLEAGKIAGLEVARLLNEPTAAALAYAVGKDDIRGTILVFDLGGGTLDVSIVTITDSHFVVKATKGNTHLGGEDFTNRLLDYVVDMISKRCGKTITNNKNAMARIKRECEDAKKRLSFQSKVNIYMNGIFEGQNFSEAITREKFCELNADLFELTLKPVEGALTAANLAKDNIDKVITVGGSSRIPKIRETLKHFFKNKEICSSINPDEAIACGAAIYAAIHNGIKIKNRENFTIEDIIPRSLGIGYGQDLHKTSFAIRKNSTIPISRKRIFCTTADNQTKAKFSVYEGDSINSRDNILLGEFTITDIPRKPAGEEEFNVVFTVDSNGILNVGATNISTGKNMNITISRRISSKYD